MTATFTNLPKNTISPSNKIKGYAQQAVYGIGVYGLAVYGVGVAGFGIFTNRAKTPIGTTSTAIGSPMGLLLTLTYATATQSSNGFTNQTKN